MLDGVVARSEYPLGYHITPLKGLLNDPNGLVYFKGNYHVFYQWNPLGTTHENKAWGHMTSPDMIHWQRETVALSPSEYYDQDGVYSGSAVVHDGKLYLFYTGTAVEPDGKKSYQCLAVSEDGRHFEKKGPVFIHPDGYTRHLRDPKVWYQEDEDMWYMVLGAQRSNQEGTVLVYTSSDLNEWCAHGELLSLKDLGLFRQKAYMWECPDVFELEGQWFLLFSPQGFEPEGTRYQNIFQTVYCPLRKEGQHFSVMDHELPELDWGFEFYAPQTFLSPDGRRLLYGWMGVMEPEMEQQLPTVTEGWVHCLTIPRELSQKKGRLYQKPARELRQLRQSESCFEQQQTWQYTSDKKMVELLLEFPDAADDFTLKIKETTTLQYCAASQRLKLSRQNWVDGAKEVRQITLTEPLNKLCLYVDGSSLEIFTNDGLAVASCRYFETGDFKVTYTGSRDGKTRIYSLDFPK